MGEISEGELRAMLRAGERIRGVMVVTRTVDDTLEYTPFLLLSSRRGYYNIVRWRGGERRYREFSRLLGLLRELGWAEMVPVYNVHDPKLRRVRAIARAIGVLPTPGKQSGSSPPEPAPEGSGEDEGEDTAEPDAEG